MVGWMDAKSGVWIIYSITNLILLGSHHTKERTNSLIFQNVITLVSIVNVIFTSQINLLQIDFLGVLVQLIPPKLKAMKEAVLCISTTEWVFPMLFLMCESEPLSQLIPISLKYIAPLSRNGG